MIIDSEDDLDKEIEEVIIEVCGVDEKNLKTKSN